MNIAALLACLYHGFETPKTVVFIFAKLCEEGIFAFALDIFKTHAIVRDIQIKWTNWHQNEQFDKT